MDVLNSGLMQLAAQISLVAVGCAVLMLIKTGVTYMTAGDNPRAKAGAYDSMINVGKGFILIGGAAVIANMLAGSLRLG